MRTESKIVPTFWTRGSGKKLRGNKAAQVLALYFMSSPHSHMMGLYYEPLISILHETGLSEPEFTEALGKISEIVLYDADEGLVFLPEGARHQIGEVMSIKDNKRRAVMSQLQVCGKHRFVRAWIERYYDAYSLHHEGVKRTHTQAPSEPLRSPFGAPSEPLLQAPDPRSDPRSDPSPRETGESGDDDPIVASLQVRAQAWVRDPLRASMSYPDPHLWVELLELVELVAATFGIEPDAIRPPGASGSLDGRVRVVLERWAEGVDQARMRQAVRGAKQNDLIASKPELQSLQTIFKDGNSVDKYCRLAKATSTPVSKSNRTTLTPEAAEKRKKFLAGQT